MAFKIKRKKENSGKDQKKKSTAKGNGRKVVRNVFLTLAGVFVIGGTTFGVHEWKNIKDVAERTSFDSDEAGRINGKSVSMAEFMIYSIDVKNGYEAQYGNSIWTQKTTDTNGNEDTFENVAKESTFEQIRFVWALLKEGEKQGIKMTDEEKKVMNSTAKDYYKTLTEAGISTDVVRLSDIKKFYKENYLAQKVYYNLTGVSANGLTEASTKSSSSSGSAESATESTTESSTQLSSEEMQKLWEKLIKKYYPDFDYKLDINWDLINEISFAEESSSTEATKSTESVTTETTQSSDTTESSSRTKVVEDTEK